MKRIAIGIANPDGKKPAVHLHRAGRGEFSLDSLDFEIDLKLVFQHFQIRRECKIRNLRQESQWLPADRRRFAREAA